MRFQKALASMMIGLCMALASSLSLWKPVEKNAKRGRSSGRSNLPKEGKFLELHEYISRRLLHTLWSLTGRRMPLSRMERCLRWRLWQNANIFQSVTICQLTVMVSNKSIRKMLRFVHDSPKLHHLCPRFAVRFWCRQPQRRGNALPHQSWGVLRCGFFNTWRSLRMRCLIVPWNMAWLWGHAFAGKTTWW